MLDLARLAFRLHKKNPTTNKKRPAHAIPIVIAAMASPPKVVECRGAEVSELGLELVTEAVETVELFGAIQSVL